jgi:hypothetical protein
VFGSCHESRYQINRQHARVGGASKEYNIMSKTNLPDEIQVLRYFETGPIEKAELLFNIISDKMRERLKDRQHLDADRPPEKINAAKRRPVVQPPSLDQREPSEPVI